MYLRVWGRGPFIVWEKFLFQVNSPSNTLTTFNTLVNCLLPAYFMNTFKCLFAGNKEKGRILKRVFQENKACQIFRKTNISYPLIRTCTCEYQGIRIADVVFDNSYFPSLSEVDKSKKTKKK